MQIYIELGIGFTLDRNATPGQMAPGNSVVCTSIDMTTKEGGPSFIMGREQI